ncbi:hypothetical protein [Virgibacillus sp. SK37]|uniref:hypothetical protein n=1 Tax=Virgibacillus sp. SK37 TaxID=403957 RepID=UPI0004D0C7B7|nr:hypothetical protein [Virgibacillus sp. SK37]AIF45718.1 hypothetical protein X953_19780 [Virgibacillus sp. SK37]
MAMIRTKKQDNPFVQLDKHFINDQALTFKAKGILTYILSKPDGWQIRLKDLVNHTADGKAAVASGLDELMEHGYIFKYQERQENGTFGDWVYEVYERPEYNPKKLEGENIIKMKKQKRENKKNKSTENRKSEYGQPPKTDFPISENPESENPESENQTYSNNEFTNNEFSNNDSINNHHHEGFSKKQSDLINEFASKHNLKIDDDVLIKLVSKLKNYKPNSLEYIEKVYETITTNVREFKSYKENTYSDNGEELFKEWERKNKELKEEQKKKSPDQLDQEKAEIEKLLNQYK